jgi:RNase P protein component
MMRVELQPDTAYVVVAPKSAVTMDFEELIGSLREAIGLGEHEAQR